eukprot:1942990-Rhodomonas_salina.3
MSGTDLVSAATRKPTGPDRPRYSDAAPPGISLCTCYTLCCADNRCIYQAFVAISFIVPRGVLRFLVSCPICLPHRSVMLGPDKAHARSSSSCSPSGSSVPACWFSSTLSTTVPSPSDLDLDLDVQSSMPRSGPAIKTKNPGFHRFALGILSSRARRTSLRASEEGVALTRGRGSRSDVG